MTDTNSEAASKKPRRGRPRMMPDEWARILRRLYPDMTERNRQNRDYAGAALRSACSKSVIFRLKLSLLWG
jgi:hypothetical protein